MTHKLLLADDSVTIQRVIELTFADEDITVIAVGNGRQAIERATVERPDIVLADVGMPERDGYEVAAFIKGTPALAHIPVLLLTGAFEPIDEGRARAAKCDGVLVKPFEPQMVINRVKDLIAGRRPAGADALGMPRRLTLNRPSASNRVAPPVDDYLDRLDAAFSAFDAEPGRSRVLPSDSSERHERASTSDAASAESRDLAGELAGWDATVPSAPVPPPPVTPTTQRPAQANASSLEPHTPQTAPVPTLPEAFAALLTAESNRPVAARTVTREPLNTSTPLSDDAIEQVTRRVIERMTDAATREIVLDVAERLVREEIERIKAQTR